MPRKKYFEITIKKYAGQLMELFWKFKQLVLKVKNFKPKTKVNAILYYSKSAL
jgi:hypothetical protein